MFLGHLDECALKPFGSFPLSARSASVVEALAPEPVSTEIIRSFKEDKAN